MKLTPRTSLVLSGLLMTLALWPILKANADDHRAYLVHVSQGEKTNDMNPDAQPAPTIIDEPLLGGKGLKIKLIAEGSVGQRVKVTDWTPYTHLRFSIVSPGKLVQLEMNVIHSGTKNYGTRVVIPLELRPGKNDFNFALAKLENTNGSRPDLGGVVRWYLFDPKNRAPTFILSDLALESGSAAIPSKSGQKPAVPGAGVVINKQRLERIKASRMPTLDRPVQFDTPEADAVLAALEVFPPDNPWNIPVDTWPVHPGSRAMIAAIGGGKPLRYNPDMGFVLVPPNQKRIDVKLSEYSDESDPGPFPVPDTAVIEGWPASFRRDSSLKGLTLNDVQRGKPTLDADRHGIIVDPINRKLYEFYRLTRTDNGWTAEQSSVFDLSSNKLRPDGWTSSDAAGLPIFPAVVRYDELKRGKIEHALRVTFSRTRRAFVYPATHFASQKTDANLPRMGERLRLRRDFDTSGFSPEVKTILEALKTYGMLNADNGIDWAISVAPDERIPVLHEELRKVKGADFEVVTPPEGYVPPQ